MKQTQLLAAVTALCTGAAMAADPATIDWARIKSTSVPLFFPGQSSYEWLRSDAHKGASRKVESGQSCVSCHDEKDAEKDLGNELVKAGRLEPTPVKAKNGFIDLSVQAAYDAKNLYLRYQWKTNNPQAGTEHQYLRFDGKEWKVWGFPKLDKVVQDGKQPAIYEDRMSIMIDDGKVPGFAQQGCWLSCHDGSRDMANAASKEDAAANPLLAALKRSDLRSRPTVNSSI
jgi:Ethylbenzene dehydrogenase